MEGEEERSEEEGSFSKKSIPKRIAIVAAGGLINIFFGLIVYFALGTITGNYISNEIETVSNQSLQTAGIQDGDKIKEINGKTIHLKSDVTEALEKSEGKKMQVLVERENEQKTVEVLPIVKTTRNIGVYFGKQDEQITSEITMVYPGSPAEKAGLEEGDIIVSINGKDVQNNPYNVVEYLNETENEKVLIEVEKSGVIETVEVIPETKITYLLGVTFKVAENNIATNLVYGFWDTVDFSLSIVDNLKMLFTGKVGTDQLMGPIGISDMVAKTSGLADFAYLLALISLSLGVTNLLPFPPLDGGKIVIYIIEAIRRKPMKENIEIGIQMIGFGLMIALSIYVAYNDVLRIL